MLTIFFFEDLAQRLDGIPRMLLKHLPQSFANTLATHRLSMAIMLTEGRRGMLLSPTRMRIGDFE